MDSAIKDFDYNEQQVLTAYHILPSDFEEEDYYRLSEVLSAQKEEDRVQTGAGFLEQLGMKADGDSDTI